MSKVEKTENDWCQGDSENEDWLDWDDADDSFVDVKNTKTSSNISDQKKIPSNNKIEGTECIQDDNKMQTKTGWGSMWGGMMSTVLSTASEGLGNITSTVSQGLNQVIGIPDPEELARINVAEGLKMKQEDQSINKPNIQNKNSPENSPKRLLSNEENDESPNSQQNTFGSSIVNGVTNLGSKVLNTGLDTLEGIGKKTMDILQENDPMLINKRKLLGLESDLPNLSQMLKEAKIDAEEFENNLKELQKERSKQLLCFDVLFENNTGLVHLEALEILSHESTCKLKSVMAAVSGNALIELQETTDQVKELLDLEDLEGESNGDYTARELNENLHETLQDIELQIKFDDIISNWSDTLDWLETNQDTDLMMEEIYAKSINILAETCALEMGKLHKIAELLLVKEHHSTANEVDFIVQLCKQFSIHLYGVTNRFATRINSFGAEEAKNQTSTLFTELLLALQHIEKAYKLFLPILQMGAI